MSHQNGHPARDLHPRPGALLGALTLAMLAFSVVQTSIVPILPDLAGQFRTSTSNIAWMMTANLLAAAVFTPLLGRIGDLRGRKPMLLLSIAGVVAGSLLAVLGGSFLTVLVGRVLMGLGGGVLPLSIAIVRDELPREKVTGGVALVSASLGVGSGLGLVATGLVMQHGGYRDVFAMGLGIAALAFVAVLFAVRKDPVVDRAGGADPLGALLLAGWLVTLLLAVSEGSRWGWGATSIVALFASAAVLLGVWVLVELKTTHPLVDVRMLAKPVVAVTNLSAMLIGFAMYASFALLSDFTQTPSAVGYGFGATVLHAGILLLPSAIGSFLGAPIGARLIGRFGPRVPMVAGGLLTGLALLSLAPWHGTQTDVYAASGVMGLGIGLAYAAMPAFINGAVPVEQSGVANGMNAVLRTVGGAVGTAVATALLTGNVIPQALLAHTPLAGHELPTVTAYHTAFIVAGALGLGAAVVPLLLRVRKSAAASTVREAGATAETEVELEPIVLREPELV
ncbi:MAG TPA: MFS transporter [Actinocrinis sp.]|uniref:MFS transporter n=1 Tax=Actinocrinis sp. TaxID=1920516 RepID=UPI002DDDB366|nr:MFS transporter [Actinocrinis sp.]HEV3172133.1 MFS transporter [Actinocrinis sp.]